MSDTAFPRPANYMRPRGDGRHRARPVEQVVWFVLTASSRPVMAREFCARFGCSIRTYRRLLAELRRAGCEIHSHNEGSRFHANRFVAFMNDADLRPGA